MDKLSKRIECLEMEIERLSKDDRFDCPKRITTLKERLEKRKLELLEKKKGN